MEMAEKIRATKPKEEAEREVKDLGESELEFHLDVMQVNDDYKNYNGWSHRQFIVSRMKLWKNEFKFVEDLLVDDVRNNSAWNHRFTVVKNTTWPLTPEARGREINFALAQLRKCASNESAWNYLGAFLGEGKGKAKWDSVPEVEDLCKGVLELATERQNQCRFAVEALAQVEIARGNMAKALEHYELLKEIDSIRAKYWEWRMVRLREQETKQAL